MDELDQLNSGLEPLKKRMADALAAGDKDLARSCLLELYGMVVSLERVVVELRKNLETALANPS